MGIQYQNTGVAGVKIVEGVPDKYKDLLSTEFLVFAAELERSNRDSRTRLLQERDAQLILYRKGSLPTYNPETADIRESEWQVTHRPRHSLTHNYVDAVTPVHIASRIFRGLDAITKYGKKFGGTYGGTLFADCEDALSPSFYNLLESQMNLWLAFRRELKSDKYAPIRDIPEVTFRPRGLHLPEIHVLVDDKPMSATNFDMALYHYTNWKILEEMGYGPNFIIPKLEYGPEGKHIDDICAFLEGHSGHAPGFADVSLIIETGPAMVHQHELYHSLKDRLQKASFGRYDAQFHIQMLLSTHADKVYPDVAYVPMTVKFLMVQQKAFVDACYKRGIVPKGGMEQSVPQSNEAANTPILERIIKGTRGEIELKMTGKWALHPDSVDPIRDEFFRALKGQNAFPYEVTNYLPKPKLLFDIPQGTSTMKDSVMEIGYVVEYAANFLMQNGAVQMDALMHDAATHEQGRAKVRNRRAHGTVMTDTGMPLDKDTIAREVRAKVDQLRGQYGDIPEIRIAGEVATEAMNEDNFSTHMLIKLYPHLVELTWKKWG